MNTLGVPIQSPIDHPNPPGAQGLGERGNDYKRSQQLYRVLLAAHLEESDVKREPGISRRSGSMPPMSASGALCLQGSSGDVRCRVEEPVNPPDPGRLAAALPSASGVFRSSVNPDPTDRDVIFTLHQDQPYISAYVELSSFLRLPLTCKMSMRILTFRRSAAAGG